VPAPAPALARLVVEDDDDPHALTPMASAPLRTQTASVRRRTIDKASDGIRGDSWNDSAVIRL
jgi:hypothetical protein